MLQYWRSQIHIMPQKQCGSDAMYSLQVHSVSFVCNSSTVSLWNTQCLFGYYYIPISEGIQMNYEKH